MNRERLAKAKDDILILAPGPINRGVEDHARRGRRPALGDSRTSDQRPGRADGRAVADPGRDGLSTLEQLHVAQ